LVNNANGTKLEIMDNAYYISPIIEDEKKDQCSSASFTSYVFIRKHK